MTEKWEQMPKDIEWHMIGHVQSNKVKYMIPYIETDSRSRQFEIAEEINRLGIRWRKTVNCLLQVHIAEEETKFGLNEKELEEIIHYILCCFSRSICFEIFSVQFLENYLVVLPQLFSRNISIIPVLL